MSLKIPVSLPDKKHWWRIAAFDGLNYGSFSELFCFLVDATPPVIQSVAITQPNWKPNCYNQKNNSTINLTISYQEHHASRARLFCSTAPHSIVKENILSGNSCTVDFPINISNITDGNHLFNASIIDSAQNTTTDTFFIRLDSTPPTGATASSPDISNTSAFMVDWQNTASYSGSGLSGVYDIQVKVNDGLFESWKTQYHYTCCEFTGGRHGYRYAFEVAAWDRVGNREPFTGMAESTTLVDTLTSTVNEDRLVSNIPDRYHLKQNYPNPFNNATCIEFGLPEAGSVKLIIYDLMGRTIPTLLDGEIKAAGIYRFNWNGTDIARNRVTSGLYFYRIEVNDFMQIKRLMFLK